jgi:copper transport protein
VRRSVQALLILLVPLLLLSRVAPALAHANLVRSNPASGAVLNAPPAQVQLWFSEQPDPHFSDIQVADANRQRVDAGDMRPAAGDPLSLVVSLKPDLADGLYTVSWKTVSAVDGHVVNGNFPFYIGQPPQGTVLPQAAQTGPASSGSSPTVATVFSRWLSLLSAVVLLGGFVFWPLILLPALGEAVAPSPGPGAMALPVAALPGVPVAIRATLRGLVLILTIAWLVVALATVIVLIQQAQAASSASLTQVFGAPLHTLLFSTRFGHTWWLRAGATALAGAALLLLRRSGSDQRLTLPACLLGAVAVESVMLSYSLNSHAAAATSAAGLATASDLLHLTAAGIWVGGLAQFALAVPVCLRELDAEQRLRLLARAVPRFSVLASICVAVLIASGLYQAVRELPGLDALWLSGWGRTLLIKLGLIVPLLLLGAANLLLVRPALARAAGLTPNPSLNKLKREDGRRLQRRFLAAVTAEALLGAAILAVVGVLVNQAPPQSAAASTAPGIHLTSKAEGVTVKLTITPGQLGPNHFEATVDVRGKPPPDGTQLVFRLTYADADMGTTEVVTQPEGNGRFSADTSDLSTYGHWQILALVQPPSADEVRTDFTMALNQTGSSGSGSVASEATSVKRGQQLYTANCAQCHGNDLHGDGPLAKQLDPPPADLIVHTPQHDDQQLLGFIANGIPASAMPAFGSKLSAQDRQAILNYLRNETKNETPTPTPSASSP